MLNLTAISFVLSTIFAFFVLRKSFLKWKKDKSNVLNKFLLGAILFIFLYLLIRALSSFLFVNSPQILTFSYILSHFFCGIGFSFLAGLAIAPFYSKEITKKVVIIFLILFLANVILNIFLPNSPQFKPDLKIIDWGTNKLVGIYFAILSFMVYLMNFLIYSYHTIKYRGDYILRTRCLIFASSFLIAIILSFCRNLIKTPLFLTFSDLGLILVLGIGFLAVSYPRKIQKK